MHADHGTSPGDRTKLPGWSPTTFRSRSKPPSTARRVQDFRKDLDVEYSERIRLTISGSERLERIVPENRDHLSGETLCSKLIVGSDGLSGAEVRAVEPDGETLKLELARG